MNIVNVQKNKEPEPPKHMTGQLWQNKKSREVFILISSGVAYNLVNLKNGKFWATWWSVSLSEILNQDFLLITEPVTITPYNG